MDDAKLKNIVQIVVNPIIKVAFAVAIIIFIYGIFEFMRNSDNPEARKQGQWHMLWGLVGLAIMVAVFTIVRIFLNTLGISGDDVPKILPR